MNTGNCNTSISHLLAAATYIDGEMKKPKAGRKSSTSVYKCEIDDMKLTFDEEVRKNSVEQETYSKQSSASDNYMNRILPDDTQQNENSCSNGSNEKSSIQLGRSPSQRSSHKYLEKHRRDKLRICLDKLKELVPLGPDVQKHTTIGLLKKTKHVIHNLKERQRKFVTFRDQLKKDQLYLRRRIEQLRRLANGGGIGLSNAILIPSTVASNVKLQSAVKPHILRKSTKAIKDEAMSNIISDWYNEFKDPAQSYIFMNEIESMKNHMDNRFSNCDEGMYRPSTIHLSVIKTEPN